MYGVNEKVFRQMSERYPTVVNKNRTVAVTISGKVGSGRSTIMAAISKALVEYGCQNVIIVEENAHDAYVSLARMKESLELVEEILSGTTVRIDVIQAGRDDII